ncbi:XisI protein [Iningainema tapete]|uniref:XisI protein n=1 Tax=Iningainema tapete BLCC-T55 TaxID=2748662 RepID=A0A8J6Y1L7_9CYAN|nr:XisI protein [Iningainema tapete]MBD2777643.1 XisI protein [Iningainema tapete BLCC-T55]
MDTLTKYRESIYQILKSHADIPYSYGEIKSDVVVSQDQNHYLLMISGWNGNLRIHGCVVDVEIINDKIWIQRDGIEDGITDDLVAAGVPKDKIVLAFHPLEVRPYTGYAVF